MSDLPTMYVVRIDGDDSDPDYTGVSKIATATGYEWRIVGPLAEALRRTEDGYRDRIAALEADARAARIIAKICNAEDHWDLFVPEARAAIRAMEKKP